MYTMSLPPKEKWATSIPLQNHRSLLTDFNKFFTFINRNDQCTYLK